jgi:hypothetical protein
VDVSSRFINTWLQRNSIVPAPATPPPDVDLEGWQRLIKARAVLDYGIG